MPFSTALRLQQLATRSGTSRLNQYSRCFGVQALAREASSRYNIRRGYGRLHFGRS